jgi:pimeloyl-ACP methyl ester carboxylesterase
MSEFQGGGRLTIDALKGITDIVEAMHLAVGTLGGLLGEPGQKHTKGISGMVYRSIRSVADLAGLGMDALLEKLDAAMEEKDSSPEYEAVLAALNGLLGDHLAERKNPLAIPMKWRINGRSVTPVDEDFAESLSLSHGKIVLMVHGLCMNDLQWNRNGHGHGICLARDFNYLPFYLHYNTGRHISENGRELADLLEAFIQQASRPVEMAVLAHSMGGLVFRSACHVGKQQNHTWLNSLEKIVFLGTPHHGAPLERGGNWIDFLLDISPYSAPFSRLGKIRSSGITDLRYGNIMDEDWKGRDRFENSGDKRKFAPLPDNVSCYTIAATMAREKGRVGDDLVGDGLVPLNSALGRHKNPALNLHFPESNQRVVRDMGHLDLLHHADVYEIIKNWLQS